MIRVSDTSNLFMVGVRNGRIVVGNLGPLRSYKGPVFPAGDLSPEDAIRFGAWLCVLADPDGKETERVMAEIRSS